MAGGVTYLITRTQVRRVLNIRQAVEAVESAFRVRQRASAVPLSPT